MHAAMLKLENSTVSFLHWPAARCRCLAAPDDVSLVDHAVPLHGEGAHRDALLGPEVAEAAQPLRGPAGGRPRHREHILRPGHHHHHQLHNHYHLNGWWSDLARLAVRKSAACEARLPPPPGVSRYFSFEVRFVGWSCDLMLWSCHLIIMWSPKFSASLASPLARWMCLALAWCLPGPCCCSVSVSLGTSRISCGAVSPLSSWHKTYSSCYLSSVLSTKSGNKRTFAKFKILQSQRASSWLKAPFSTFILSTDMVRDSVLSVRSLVGQFVTHFSSRSKMTFVPGTRFHVYLPFINTCKKGGAISVIVKSLRRIAALLSTTPTVSGLSLSSVVTYICVSASHVIVEFRRGRGGGAGDSSRCKHHHHPLLFCDNFTSYKCSNLLVRLRGVEVLLGGGRGVVRLQGAVRRHAVSPRPDPGDSST